MRSVILDTRIWIWLSIEKQDLLPLKAKDIIENADQKWISVISCWELSKLAEKNRISFSIPLITWIRRSLNELNPDLAFEIYYDFEKGFTCCVSKKSFGIKIFQYSSTKTLLHTLPEKLFHCLTTIPNARSGLKIHLAELSPEIAVESTMLKGFHKDPADQIIVATARIYGMPLLTSDKRILDFKDIESIWN